MPHAWFLVPGYGSQGATVRDVAGALDARGLGAIINNSRAIILRIRGPNMPSDSARRWQQAVEAATRQMIAELAADSPAGKLV